MYLFINTSEREYFYFCLFDESVVAEKKDTDTTDVLGGIQNFLKEQNKTMKDIQGIAVLVGKGTFSSTRSAVSVANAWAFAEHIPVVTVQPDKPFEILEIIKLLQTKNPGDPVVAEYSGVPNITQPK